jgi:hypothetical protein
MDPIGLAPPIASMRPVDLNVCIFMDCGTRIQASKAVQKRGVKRHVFDALDPLQCDRGA